MRGRPEKGQCVGSHAIVCPSLHSRDSHFFAENYTNDKILATSHENVRYLPCIFMRGLVMTFVEPPKRGFIMAFLRGRKSKPYFINNLCQVFSDRVAVCLHISLLNVKKL